MKLIQEVGHFAVHALDWNESQTILSVPTLVNLSFAVSLLIYVGIHVIFGISGLPMALTDRVSARPSQEVVRSINARR